MNRTNSLIKLLHWDAPIKQTELAINQLIDIDEKEVIKLLQPLDKCYWENAALVIQKIGYPRNKQAIPGLLRWLQDMNWPGAETALITLQDIEKTEIVIYIENALQEAAYDNDEMWIGGIKRLIENMKIVPSDFKDPERYNLLELSDW